MNMKIQSCLIGVFLLCAEIISGQTNQQGKLIIPFLDEKSQSNVSVTVSDVLGDGQPCPAECTNTLSNTNLFALEEQRLIKDVFVKYANVTTNSGLPGVKLAILYKTNYTVRAMNRTMTNENWVGQYQYTNFGAQEEIRFGSGLFAKYRTQSNDGYNVYIGRTGGGSILRFMTVKGDRISGVLAEFDDSQPQGMSWDYKRTSFTNSILTAFRQYTNGMVFGKFFLWDTKGQLKLAAEFKKPYDFEKYIVPWP
jgi:hypothetical protein